MPTKKVLVFGATGGIGHAIAIKVAKIGYHIVALGRSQPALNTLKEEITLSGGSCDIYTIDLNSSSNTEEVTKSLLATYKKFDWVIHAAGMILKKEVEHALALEDIRETLRVNTEAVIYINEALLPHLGSGGIIFISSTGGIWGNKDYPVYSASKGAINAYGAAVARRLEGSDTISIVIAPGATNTPMRELVAQDAASVQSPTVIARVITNILSGDSQYKNGDIITVREGKDTSRSQL